MSVEERQIREITESVWSSMLGSSADAFDGSDTALDGTVLTGCVHVTGAWEGAVTICCSPLFARAAAAAMFGLEDTEPSREETRDALGELANVVGGNIKALLPGTTHLSLPTVAEGNRSDISVTDSRPMCTVWFATAGEPFMVTVLTRRNGARAPLSSGNGHALREERLP
ncbi:MAG TPA: chemotaxis protein CheX [Polyangiaceae bacterium]|jgi:chemotaxis protein CheX|nr:chemotaxis protein CheX [Polyangiaceae bacterium]